MIAIGLDVHVKRTAVALLDTQTGQTRRTSADTAELASRLEERLADADRDQCRVCIEVSATGTFVARLLHSYGFDVVVVDAFKAHRVIESQNTAKTDQRDATALARLLAAGQADAIAVWVPDPPTMQLRTLTRGRETLVKHNTMLRNAVRSVIRIMGATCPYDDLTGRGGRQWVEQFIASQPPLTSLTCQTLFNALLDTKARIGELEQEIVKIAKTDDTAQRLMTIHGCGAVLALTIAAEIGDISRFETAGQLRSYSGLTPGIHQSGDKSRTGPLTRRGNPHLRRAVMLLAQHVSRSKALQDTPLKRAHYRVLVKHGPNPAKAELGRRLLSVIHAMLRNGTDFDAQRAA